MAIAAIVATACGASAALAHSTGGGGWGSGYPSATSHSSSSKGPTVKLAHSSKGSILVNSAGRTLYLFTADKKNTDRCAKVSGCLGAWPALTVSGKPTAGPGVKASMLGTIAISGGKKQVTYNGHPLYLYVGDSSSAQTSYIGASGFGGTWYGVNASGAAVH
jgi:predicted lipoprotein with Yx(FWY)xxD motif